jgi:hypothetical protein
VLDGGLIEAAQFNRSTTASTTGLLRARQVSGGAVRQQDREKTLPNGPMIAKGGVATLAGEIARGKFSPFPRRACRNTAPADDAGLLCEAPKKKGLTLPVSGFISIIFATTVVMAKK